MYGIFGNHMIKAAIYFGLAVLGFIIVGICLGEDQDLTRIDVFLQLLLTVGILIAFSEFQTTLSDLREKREREANDYALSVLNFFRTDVIPLNLELIQIYIDKNVVILELDIGESMDFNSLKFFNDQIFSEYQIIINNNKEIGIKTVNLLNCLEEMSARIVIPHNEDHRANRALRLSFIQIVEQNALALWRLINLDGFEYPHLIQLYNFWKPQIGRIKKNNENMDNLRNKIRQIKKTN